MENKLDVLPNDENFPLQLVLDAEEGADLPDAEDYSLEVKFADHVLALPSHPVVIGYAITDLEGDMIEQVTIDKIVYEYEDDDCTYEREIAFTQEGDGTHGTITIPVDSDLGTTPESFEVVFTLPGLETTEGGFAFGISNLQSTERVILGAPLKFNYEVLDSDVAGEWEFQINDEEQFTAFKSIFASLSSDLEELDFADITGKVKAEFDFGEMKFVIELVDEEEEITCEDGEIEVEVVNQEIEIEAEYETDDEELEFEGSHFVIGGDGEIEDELDFQIKSTYSVEGDVLMITFLKAVDEDHFKDGDGLFIDESGITFPFQRD